MTVIDTQAALYVKIKRVCDVLRRSNCAGALQYVPELTWLLFLRFLDEREELEARDAKLQGIDFRPSLIGRYRWSSWASPRGHYRKKLQSGSFGEVFNFLHHELLPYLHQIGSRRSATPRQQLISQIVDDVQETQVDTEHNFLDVIESNRRHPP